MSCLGAERDQGSLQRCSEGSLLHRAEAGPRQSDLQRLGQAVRRNRRGTHGTRRQALARFRKAGSDGDVQTDGPFASCLALSSQVLPSCARRVMSVSLQGTASSTEAVRDATNVAERQEAKRDQKDWRRSVRWQFAVSNSCLGWTTFCLREYLAGW